MLKKLYVILQSELIYSNRYAIWLLLLMLLFLSQLQFSKNLDW